LAKTTAVTGNYKYCNDRNPQASLTWVYDYPRLHWEMGGQFNYLGLYVISTVRLS